VAVTGEHYPLIELIQVGDVVTFKMKAWDPQAREITWGDAFHGETPQLAIELAGSDVEFDWHISDSEVGENVPLIGVTMSSSGDYHRNRKHDGFVLPLSHG
jgi:hypothetical protein